MPKDAWITAEEATQILSRNNGREVVSSYIRGLARRGKVSKKVINARTYLYKRSEVEKIVIGKPRGQYAPKKGAETAS